MSAVLLNSAARTATTVAPERKAFWRDVGIMLFLNVTGNPGGAETLTLSVQGQDPASGTFANVASFPATTANTNALYVYELRPGLVETNTVANHEVQSTSVPPIWRARIVHSSTGSWTYTLGYYTVS